MKIGRQVDLGIEVIILSKFNSLGADIFLGFLKLFKSEETKSKAPDEGFSGGLVFL